LSDFETRQLNLMKIFVEDLSKTQDLNNFNHYINNIEALLNFFEEYTEWHQAFLENWGTLEIINAVMCNEQRTVFSLEDISLKNEAIANLSKLLDNPPTST
jgi:predicted RNA-binding protein with EMAP domain